MPFVTDPTRRRLIDILQTDADVEICEKKNAEKRVFVLSFKESGGDKPKRRLAPLKGKARCVIRDDFKMDDEEFLSS